MRFLCLSLLTLLFSSCIGVTGYSVTRPDGTRVRYIATGNASEVIVGDTLEMRDVDNSSATAAFVEGQKVQNRADTVHKALEVFEAVGETALESAF